MNKPHIMITNDDGINAPGIYHLWKALSEIANITIIAPFSEQSAASLSITTRLPLRIEKFLWKNNVNAWSVSGTPADCVKMGLSVLLEEKPDLVVSGINRGTNAGRNVLYSGTVAGAIEAVMNDIPGVAFSCFDYDNPQYELAEQHIPSIIQHIFEHPLPKGTLLNVNFPCHFKDNLQGFKLTQQGKERWAEDPHERSHPVEGHNYYWLGAKIIPHNEEEEDSDVNWLKKGYVSAVPVHVGQLTHQDHVKDKRKHFEDLFYL